MEDIEKRYNEYKRVVHKIGLTAAQTQYMQGDQNLGQPFHLLREFHFIQSSVYLNRNNPELANAAIRSTVRWLSDDTFIQSEGQSITLAMDLFEDLENIDTMERSGSLNHVVEGFVHLPTRIDLIRSLAHHDEFCFLQHMQRLLDSAYILGSHYLIQLSDMALAMVETRSVYAPHIRFKLVEMQLLPELVTRLTVTYCHDEVDFLNGIFHHTPTWFIAQSTRSSQFVMAIKSRLFESILRLRDSNGNQVELAIVVRALVGLVGFFGINMGDDEVLICIDILRTTQTERVVDLLLCLLMIAPDRFLQQKDFHHATMELLRKGVSEMTMLMVVFLQSNQTDQVIETVRSTLDMHVPINDLRIHRMQVFFKRIPLNP